MIKKHSTLFIILGIIIVVVAAMVYIVLQPQQAGMPNDNVGTDGTQQADNGTKPGNNGQATEPSQAVGTYEDYSEDAFNQAEGRRVIFFYAPWCPQCRALDASIKENTVPNGVTIFKLDYDSNQALRQKYGVTIQTTLVEVDAGGNEVKKYVAYDEPTFDAVMAAMKL